jgi:hypothetical protein
MPLLKDGDADDGRWHFDHRAAFVLIPRGVIYLSPSNRGHSVT